MNKTKIILSATGGVAALAVLALGVMTYLAFADRTAAFEGGEDSEGLESAVAKVTKLMGKTPFPSAENQKRLLANAQTVTDWCADVRKEASKGDWCAPSGCTPAQFKEQIATDVKAINQLKGATPEPLVKPDFGFGPFKEYLADKMPSVEQLPRLQRQWYDLTALIKLLATNGVSQITDVQVVDRSAEAAKKEAAEKNAKGKKKQKAKKAAETGVRQPSVETYVVSFVATPASFADVVQELSFQDRFTVVEDFVFVREHDAIAENLGGGEKKDAAASASTGGRRSGRRRAAAAREETAKADENGAKKSPVIFDPEKDSAVKVDLTVSVYDFRSLEEEEETSK